MRLLALDTSTEYCSVALWLDGEIHEREQHALHSHSELIVPMIASVLDHAAAGLDSLNGIAFGSGPGSFTGLRIACGIAQGLAFGAGLKVVPVSTLLALAEGAGADRVLACLDARMGEVYHAAYEKRDGSWQTCCEPGLYAPENAPDVAGSGWTGCGSGFAVHEAKLKARYGKQLVRALPEARPRAGFIARLAAPVFAAQGGVEPWTAAPVYIRDKVALKTHERA